MAIISFALLPSRAYTPSRVRGFAVAPYQDRQRLTAETVKGVPRTLGADRVGAGVLGSFACCQRDSEPMASFLLLVNRIHSIVGDRVTYNLLRDGKRLDVPLTLRRRGGG